MDIVEFKPSQLSVTLVKVYDNDVAIIKKTLETKLAKAGKFLRGASVFIVPSCELSPKTLAQLIELLRQHDMVPIGINTTDPVLIDYAELSGFAVLTKPITERANQTEQQPLTVSKPDTLPPPPSQQPETAPSPEEDNLQTAKIIPHSMRSGQMAQHLLNDVIVRGSVNSGAEVYAGGNLNVYGAVRGRVHAGATGNKSSRIVAYNFNPELVSIAGVFLLSDDIPSMAKKGWIEVSLENQRLKFTTLG